MKVLVTGGAGFIGTNLIKRLVKEGHTVSSIDNYDSGLESNHQHNVTYKNDDITNIDKMPRDFDKIFHLAALSRIQPSFNNPSETYRVNSMGTQQVLEFARLTGAKVVYAGSSSKWHDPYQSPYAACKYMGEEVCKMYKKTYGMDIEIARFYNVYGEHQANEGSYCNVLGIFQRKFFDDEPLTITGDGEQRRDFTYVGDIVDGLVRCGKALFMAEINGESFELGNGKNYSVNEVANAFGEDYPKEHIDARPGEVRESLNEDRKAREVLGWNPKGDIVKFVKENYVLKK